MHWVDLECRTAWLNRTKNGTPRGVPLNEDAVAVLEGEKGKHPRYCFTYRGEPIRWGVCNTAELRDFGFHDLRHTWASCLRQPGTSCDELKEPGGWKSRVMVDRYAKLGTEHLAATASRITVSRRDQNVVYLSRSGHGGKNKKRLAARR